MTTTIGNVAEPYKVQVTASTKVQERKTIQASLSRPSVSLVIIDLAFDGSSLWVYSFSRMHGVIEELSSLPAHQEGAARIFDYPYDFNKEHLEQLWQYLRNTYPNCDATRIMDKSDVFAYGMDSIASQWTSDIPDWLMANDNAPKSSKNGQFQNSSKFLRCMPVGENRSLSRQIKTPSYLMAKFANVLPQFFMRGLKRELRQIAGLVICRPCGQFPTSFLLRL